MKTILFACTENKKRSKIAEAIFNHLAKERSMPVRAVSAGTIPAEKTDPQVANVLSRHGIEYTEHKPQKLDNEMLNEADHIVSFGCLIPGMFPKSKFEEWLVDDPYTAEEYENVFLTIQKNILALQDSLSKQA